MSKKMLLGVLAAVMLSGEISASPVLAQNLYADRDVTEIMEANGKSYCPAECKEKEERKEAVKGEKKTGTTRMERSRR